MQLVKEKKEERKGDQFVMIHPAKMMSRIICFLSIGMQLSPVQNALNILRSEGYSFSEGLLLLRLTSEPHLGTWESLLSHRDIR